MKHIWFLICAFSLNAGPLWSQVSLSSAAESMNQNRIRYPIILQSAGPLPSAVDFEFVYDNRNMTFVGVDKALNLKDAGKNLRFSTLRKNHRSAVKVVIWGVNQTSISDGPICYLNFLSHSTRSKHSSSIKNASASDFEGRRLSTVLPQTAKRQLAVSSSLDSNRPYFNVLTRFDKPIDLYLRRILLINGEKVIRDQLIRRQHSGEISLEQPPGGSVSQGRLLIMAVRPEGDPKDESDIIGVREVERSALSKVDGLRRRVGFESP
jgi:hypothetical protein